jgi:prepilin-type processing-associated H-X9-DG protein
MVPPGGGSSFTYTDPRTAAFGSRHTNGANFALVDGSVRFITNTSTSSLAILQALATRAGGEVQSAP